ncbi:MAG TPA: hypothetical protein VLC48_04570, partial [Gemmatimonadota bacterium]|nr:hypothetical protein [Gemmatimonadota bacterium]
MKRRHRGVGTPCAAAFVIAAAVLAAQSGCRQAFDAEAAIAEIEARYGVPIVYEMQPGFLPHQWLGPPADG